MNFRLVQTTLILLARQLRILERHVAVDVPLETLTATSSKITVTEIQLGDKNRKKSENVAKGRKTADPRQNVSLQLEEKSSIHTMHKAKTDGKTKNVKNTRSNDDKTEKIETSENFKSISKNRMNVSSKNASFRKSISDTMTDVSFDHKSTSLLKQSVSSSSEVATDETMVILF